MTVLKRVLVLQFKCLKGKDLEIVIQKPRNNISYALIRPIAEEIIVSQILKNNEGFLVADFKRAFYTNVMIEQIMI